MKNLAYLNKYFKKYKWRFLAGILFVVLSNYFRVLQPQMIREALDLVVDNLRFYSMLDGFEAQRYLYSTVGTLLLYFGILVFLLALIMGVFMYFMRQTIIVQSRLIEYDIRKEIFDKYESLDLGFFRSHNTGDLMARISEDVTKVRMYLGPAILYFINLASLFLMVIYSMFNVNLKLALFTLLPLPFLSLSIYFVSRMIHNKSTLIQNQLSFLNSIAQEVYSGIRVVKSYVQEAPMGSFFSEESEEYKQKSLDLARINALFFPLMLLLIGTSTIITIYVGGIQVIRGAVTPGNIAEFVIYVNMLTWPVTSIGWIASIVQQAEASQERINEYLNVRPSITSEKTEKKELSGHIVFENVCFVYPDSGIKALDNVSFEIKPGEKWGIVGRTAAGKTTIADLILRMFDVSEGRILIDGEDIRDIDLANLRDRIGYVKQDTFLFSDTVKNNISFGKRDASPEEIRQYAEYAAVHKDIIELPKQYESLVGERGVSLSGGQKQRISIARALIKDPDIVILDDSLSAVDTATEQKIINYLETALSEKTAIMITHRLNILQRFDQIIVLEEGRIVESGSHEELVEEEGIYSDILEQQRFEHDEDL